MSPQPEHPPWYDDFLRGTGQFNRLEFFECHETLEAVWKEQTGDDKEFTQGLIQIAVGYHHLLRGNLPGARKLLLRGLDRVRPHAPHFRGLGVGGLVRAVERILRDIEDRPPDEKWSPEFALLELPS